MCVCRERVRGVRSGRRKEMHGSVSQEGAGGEEKKEEGEGEKV